MTALMWAAYNGKAEVTKFLVDAGASIEAKDSVSKTISILSYLCVCVCVCVCVDKFILPSYCMI